MAKEIKSALHELEVWNLADNGWKTYLTVRLQKLQEQRNRDLNTPKAAQINDLFLGAVGINSISTSWKWGTNMSSIKAAKKLDKYVTLRGSIAHRGQGSASVKKSAVEDYLKVIKTLAAKTGGAVNAYVKTETGKPLWTDGL